MRIRHITINHVVYSYIIQNCCSISVVSVFYQCLGLSVIKKFKCNYASLNIPLTKRENEVVAKLTPLQECRDYIERVKRKK